MKELATLAGGCFWCTEAIFKRLKGVAKVTPGYTGGQTKNPTYDQVASGKTGHAESVQIEFDPQVISFTKLLKVFWQLHNPTTLNQQGADIGTEYRSAIFYHSPEQKQLAEQSKKAAQQMYSDKIVTEIAAASGFYPAEEDQIDFYEKYRYSPYCQIVIDPKIQKLYKDFKPEVRDGNLN